MEFISYDNLFLVNCYTFLSLVIFCSLSFNRFMA
jgi:hypothetical protein